MDLVQGDLVHDLRGDGWGLVHDNQDMPDETANRLRAWRKFRGLTQQQLADAVDPPTTKSVIAALETGQNGLSAKWLHRLAPALGTSPGFLLDHDPNTLDRAWTEATDSVPRDRRDEAIEILRVLTRRR